MPLVVEYLARDIKRHGPSFGASSIRVRGGHLGQQGDGEEEIGQGCPFGSPMQIGKQGVGFGK